LAIRHGEAVEIASPDDGLLYAVSPRMRAWTVVLLISACNESAPADLVIDPQLPTPMDVLVVVDDTALDQTAKIPDPTNQSISTT
jgi:hypothetical protein